MNELAVFIVVQLVAAGFVVGSFEDRDLAGEIAFLVTLPWSGVVLCAAVIGGFFVVDFHE